MAKAINSALSEHIEFFTDFDKIIVYYDDNVLEEPTVMLSFVLLSFGFLAASAGVLPDSIGAAIATVIKEGDILLN